MKYVVTILLGFQFLSAQSGLIFLTESYDAVSLASGSAYQANQLNKNFEFIPSALSLSEQKYISTSYQRWISGVDVTSIRYASKLFSLGFGIHTTIYNVADIEQRDIPSINPIGIFNNYNAKLGFSFSHELTNTIFIGMSYKLIREKNAIYSAEGSAFDFNLLYKRRKLSAFIGYYNIGSIEELRIERTQLPESFAIGAKYDFDEFVTGAEIRTLDEKSTVHLFGHYQPISLLRFMGGYVINNDSRNWSFGLSIFHDQFEISYAYANHRFLEFYQNIQVSIVF